MVSSEVHFRGRGILLDIEGTTSSISFVYDVMFPFARRELDRFLRTHWSQAAVREVCCQLARDAGFADPDNWPPRDSDALDQQRHVRDEVLRLMDADGKTTGLKQLQGLLWQAGFDSGELRAHVYPDVTPALEHWRQLDLDVRVYSSGSVLAQQLFFGHTTEGDLRGYFRGHYDTSTGPKKETASYRAIAAEFGLQAEEILFVSDVVDELDAARQAGLLTVLSERPGNPPDCSAGMGTPSFVPSIRS